MSIKIEPFKNNIGASISYDLKSIKADEVDQTKETLITTVLFVLEIKI